MKKCNYFYFFFIVYVVFFILCFPKFIHYKWLESTDFILWKNIHSIFHNNIFGTQKYYRAMRNNMPAWVMPYAVLGDGINMVFGFLNYKKKWWYYLILVVSILFSILLLDCYVMYNHDDV